MFGWLDLKVDFVVSDLNYLDRLLSEVGGNFIVAIENKREVASKELWRNLTLKESLLRQNSKVDLLKDGNCNYKFFHNAMKE